MQLTGTNIGHIFSNIFYTIFGYFTWFWKLFWHVLLKFLQLTG